MTVTMNITANYQNHAALYHRAVLLWQPHNNHDLHRVEQALADLATPTVWLHKITHNTNRLGSEHSLLLVDLNQKIPQANQLVSLSSTLIGGGLLIVTLPFATTNATTKITPLSTWLREWLALVLKQQSNHQIAPYTSTELINFLSQWHFQPQTKSYQPNLEQRTVLQALHSLQAQQALVLTAPRGRGKTATLAYWLQQLRQQKIKQHTQLIYFVCAPSKVQAQLLLQDGACFIAPDQLHTQSFTHADLLVVDEAASLPFPAQRALLNFPGRLILATTTEGYEYAGRGFMIRFLQDLRKAYDQVKHLTLTEPMRWAKHDPIEAANQHLFALDISLTDPSSCKPQKQTKSSLTKQTLRYQHHRLIDLSIPHRQAVLRLLVHAHYQTSPNDIARLYDDNHQWLWLQYQGTSLVGVIWYALEGPLNADLSQAVTQGQRRLPGHLIPQTLAYYCKAPELAQYQHARIVRIAVQPHLQAQGLGSQLLQAFEQGVQELTHKEIATLGTSFGAQPGLIRFWQQQQWQSIRLGHKTDPASRYPSAIFIKPLIQKITAPIDQLAVLFKQELLARYRLHLVSQAVYEALIQTAQETSSVQPPLTTEQILTRWHQLGKAFTQGQLNFQDYQAWLYWAFYYQQVTGLTELDKKVLSTALQDNSHLVQLAQIFQFSGKKEALSYVQSICRLLHHKV